MKQNHSKPRTRLAHLLDSITPPEEHLSTTATAHIEESAAHATTENQDDEIPVAESPVTENASPLHPVEPLNIAPFAHDNLRNEKVSVDSKGTEVTESSVNTNMGANNERESASVRFANDGVYYAGAQGSSPSGSIGPGSIGPESIGPGSTDATSITIKGRADGVLIEIGRGGWNELMDQLAERLRQAAGFFRGGKVTLNVGLRPLQEEELRLVRSVLEQFGMTLGVVRSASEQTCQLALAFGLAASLDAPDGLQAQPAASNHETLQHFVYRGNLRSGQVLRRRETVLVLGDVNPGSQVISHGDILVWGRLRGIAHAGATGDEHAIISALSMEPTQLRIAGLIAILPEVDSTIMDKWFGRRTDEKRPEIAYVADEQIFVESWDESKPGGIMAFRR